MDIILKTLQDFIKGIVDALVKIIEDIIMKVIDQVFKVLNGIGGGIFANAFTEFSSGLRTEVSLGINNLRKDLGKTIDEAFPKT